jgi:hypothetical protein
MCKVLLALSLLLLVAGPALAYTGPGADVTFITTAVTLLLWMLAMFSAVLLWPFYALLRMIRHRQNPPEVASIREETVSNDDLRSIPHG